MKIISYLRNDYKNIIILNYLSLFYLFSLMVSYRISGAILYVIAIVFFFNENIKNHIMDSLNNKFVQACILYFLIYVIWLFGTEEISYGLAQVKINKVFLYSILFVAIIRKEFIEKFMYVFFAGLLINVIWSYLMFFDIVGSPFALSGYYLPLLEKTDHGFFILVGMAYLLFRLLRFNDKISYKIFFILFICLESFNIFITNNKTIMFLYLVMVAITLLYIYRNNFIKIIIGLFVFTGLFLIILNVFLPNVKNNLLKEVNGIQQSLTTDNYFSSMGQRIGIAKYSLDVFYDNILFGVGTGDHAKEVIKKLNESNLKVSSPMSYKKMIYNLNTGKASSLHNTYLQILVQFGILGLFVFLNIFYRLFKLIDNSINVYSYLLLVVLLIVLLQIFTGWDFQFGNLGNFFIIFVAMLSTQIQSDKQYRVSSFK